VGSEQKPTHAILEDSVSADQHRAFLEKAQEVAHIGSWVAELDGSNRLSWSTELYRIFGVSVGDFPGSARAFIEHVHPEDVAIVREASAAAIEGGKPYDVVHRIVTGDGRTRWVHQQADVIRDESGRPIRMIGTAQDITDRRQLELQLRHSQKMEAIGRLAGGVAHDFNNALTIISGYTELVLSALAEDDPTRADVEEIRRAATRAESVTRQLLMFSRQKATELRAFDLNKVVSGLSRLLERALGSRVLFRAELAPSLPMIRGDAGQIEQAIVNLTANARDAISDGGEVTIETAVRTVDQTFSRAHDPMPAGSYVILSVSDTGHGFDRETQARIFEPFFTTKAIGKGTGLGLAMVYGSVKQSGGFIFVESEVGRGTTFRLYFPAVDLPVETKAPHQRPSEPAVAATVLLAEDEDSILNLVTASLKSEGYRLLTAASGQQALTVAAAAGRPPDLVVTDTRLADMRGFDLGRQLLEKYPETAVILMSSGAEDLTSVIGSSMTLLQKPFTPSQLRAHVRATLNERRQRLSEERSRSRGLDPHA
jgi:two-component system cell cycle sensor histidine kinase/response regulator CckA